MQNQKLKQDLGETNETRREEERERGRRKGKKIMETTGECPYMGDFFFFYRWSQAILERRE